MITHDTRLLQKWIVFIIAIQLSTVEATVTTSCDIPSVDEGQQTKLTCMFSEDISRAQVDFKVELYSLKREPLSVAILDCVWFNGKLDCRVHSCCSFDRKVTDNATLVILNATQDLVGKYMCHVVPSSPGSSHFCNFTVNKIVSTDRPTAIGTDGVESNSSPVVPVVVGVVVSVAVAVIAIIVIVYMRRKGRCRNVLSDNIPTEDKTSESEDSQRQSLTNEEPAHENSEVDTLLEKSESVYFDTTDSNTALDIIDEKCPKETRGYVQKSTNNPGRPHMFEDGQQSEKMTEAKHSDTTISETEDINLDTDNKCSFLQETTTIQGDLNDSRSASFQPDSENCTPCLPNLDKGAPAVPDNAEMDSHNTPSHTLPFSDANPNIKEESTVNDKDSRPCSLAAQDPLVNTTNGKHTEVSENTEHNYEIINAKFDKLVEFPDLTSENKKEEEDFILEFNGSTT